MTRQLEAKVLYRAARLGAASWCAFSGLVHIYWVAGGDAGLPEGMYLVAHPRLLAAALLAIPLSLVFAWVAAGRGATLRRAVVAEGALPALTERERLALYLYEPVWLMGGLLLSAAAMAIWREAAAWASPP